MTSLDLQKIYFPHPTVRESQEDLIVDIEAAIASKNHLLAHAPTGLGKTASSLCVALAYALEHKKTVFFLTSRHTQHTIAIETLKSMKQQYGIPFVVTDIIAKKWMCAQGGVEALSSSEFSEYCKHSKEHKTCEYFENTKSGLSLSVHAKSAIDTLSKITPLSTHQMVERVKRLTLCPYEISIEIAKKADVVIADYNYVFHPTIQESFFGKTGIKLSDSIIIIDEGHNLPSRMREMQSSNLSTFILFRAQKEAEKFKYEETLLRLNELHSIISSLSVEEESLIPKAYFVSKVEQFMDYDQLMGDLSAISKEVLLSQRLSFIGSVATFLDSWMGEDEGFARILTKTKSSRGDQFSLSYRCLDPSKVTRSVIKPSHSTILMSGTLTPTSMYKELLGFPLKSIEKMYPSPFPKENKLAMIIPKTSTKFTGRTDAMYSEIANVLASIVNTVPGNSLVFFPSYDLRDKINTYFHLQSKKTLLLEHPLLTSPEKIEMLETFKKYKNSGAVLLGVTAGNFSEGIDLPGDLLKCVVVVGLPLSKPDLETKELIAYYDLKFNKGWDYGYIYPAFNKCLQSAGRCIRSETDRGVLIFLDERFSWGNYYKCFPKDMDIKISGLYEDRIKNFFEEKEFAC